MEVTVKIRFNASKEKFETYGQNRYLIYFPFEENNESEMIIASLLSKKIGVPQKRIFFKSKDAMGNWIFELT